MYGDTDKESSHNPGEDRVCVEKGPTAEATDAPQP
jgi:hypothetical protein